MDSNESKLDAITELLAQFAKTNDFSNLEKAWEIKPLTRIATSFLENSNDADANTIDLWLRRASELSRSDSDSRFQYAYGKTLWFRKSDELNSIKALEEAAKTQHEKSVLATKLLGAIYDKKGHTEQARHWYTKCMTSSINKKYGLELNDAHKHANYCIDALVRSDSDNLIQDQLVELWQRNPFPIHNESTLYYICDYTEQVGQHDKSFLYMKDYLKSHNLVGNEKEILDKIKTIAIAKNDGGRLWRQTLIDLGNNNLIDPLYPADELCRTGFSEQAVDWLTRPTNFKEEMERISDFVSFQLQKNHEQYLKLMERAVNNRDDQAAKLIFDLAFANIDDFSKIESIYSTEEWFVKMATALRRKDT